MEALTKHSLLKHANTTTSNSSSPPRQRYIDAEFDALDMENGVYLKVHSAAGATKWLSITKDQVQRIREIPKESQQ
jgi:hypothetical protein